MRYSTESFEGGWKYVNALSQNRNGLFSACFYHAVSFHSREENSTVAENDCDLLNKPDL